MKKLFYLFLIPLFFAACSSDDDENGNLPIENLKLPTSSEAAPLKNSDALTINGKGFKDSDEFWFTSTTKATESATSGKGEIIEVTDSYVKLMPSKGASGRQTLTMKRGGEVYTLGHLYFATEGVTLKKRMTKYMHSNDDDHDYYALEYNANGFVSKITDGDDKGVHSVTTLTYENNKLTKVTETETGDEAEVYNISYNADKISIKYNKIENGVNKEIEDIITLDEKGNAKRIDYADGDGLDITYDAKGNIATLSEFDDNEDYRNDYSFTYDDKPSFLSNSNLPAWFLVYDEFDTVEGGLVNNVLKVNNKDVCSYTYDNDGYPVKIKDLEDEDELEIEITYETF